MTLAVLVIFLLVGGLSCQKVTKNPLDLNEMDIERLYDQWEEKDEEEKAPPPLLLDPSKFKDTAEFIKQSKKGKTLMTFVSVRGKPTKKETEMLTERWQVGLTNNHLRCERFVIDDNRAIFVFEDGKLAFDAIDYLTSQPELEDFTIDSQVYPNKAHPKRDEL